MSIQTNPREIMEGLTAVSGIRGVYSRDKRAVLYVISLGMDSIALIVGHLVASSVRANEWLQTGGTSLVLVALPFFIMLEIAREAQSVEALASRTVGLRRALGALGGAAFVILAASFLLKVQDISRLGFVTMFGVAAVLIVLNKVLLDQIFIRWMRGSATASVLLLDGMAVQAYGKTDVIDVRAAGLTADLSRPAVMETLSRIIAPYDRVVVACRFEDRPAWATFLKSHDVGGEILLDRDSLQSAVTIGRYGDQDTLVLSQGPLNLSSRIQKRAFDIVVGGAALLFLAPLVVLIALLIKVESPGPVFFRQKRIGQGNRQFKIYKFRSMCSDLEDGDGKLSTQRNDPRITKVGKFIRRTSIDELPQIFNVLIGDMSIVGPRPHALGSLAGNNLFWDVSRQYWIRHALKPGMTGLAQVRGLRGSTETEDDLKKRIRADLEYMANWSIGNDVLIVLRTIRVLLHSNAY